ncbi:MAG: CoA ester lyase [Woeseiaceae bacterium]|nr:CoA ester lyase [Woeseiaceae bacterium]
MTRCLLFVPADSERKLARAADVSVDALILDLEDAVTSEARPKARAMASEFIGERDDVWVRINPLSTPDAEKDLAAVIASAPAGIVLPKPESAADVNTLSGLLDKLEAQHAVPAGQTKIIALCTERVKALFSLGGYTDATARLEGLSWGAEDLSAEVGAKANRDAEGNWLPPYELARSLCLFAAHAAEVAAIDTVFTDFRDDTGLVRYATNAARDGFNGMLAIHPGQVEIIQSAFMPADDEIARARRIVELFEAHPDAGALSLDGMMLDRPHLIQAQRIVALANKEG